MAIKRKILITGVLTGTMVEVDLGCQFPYLVWFIGIKIFLVFPNRIILAYHILKASLIGNLSSLPLLISCEKRYDFFYYSSIWLLVLHRHLVSTLIISDIANCEMWVCFCVKFYFYPVGRRIASALIEYWSEVSGMNGE